MNISIKGLGVTINDKEIVRNIDIDLQNKEFVGLIGPNGSGKSTILKTVYRSLKKTRGNIYFDGIDLENVKLIESARKLGVMKQISQLAFDFKVIDLVLLGRTPYKQQMELDNADDYGLARRALAQVGMSTFEERNYNDLSGGEQQRVMMARVLAGQPKTLLLDELTNHLDVYYQFHLLNVVKNLQVEVLAVMHDLNMAARYCDKIYCLADGEIIAYGKTEDVLTSALIEKVFRIQASIIKSGDGKIQVIYNKIVN